MITESHCIKGLALIAKNWYITHNKLPTICQLRGFKMGPKSAHHQI